MKQNKDFPPTCAHYQFFGCKTSVDCKGCYYNPDEKEARYQEDPNDPRGLWFYSDKRHAKAMLKTLDDIRHGRGLMPGGQRTWFKNARKKKKKNTNMFLEDLQEETNES